MLSYSLIKFSAFLGGRGWLSGGELESCEYLLYESNVLKQLPKQLLTVMLLVKVLATPLFAKRHIPETHCVRIFSTELQQKEANLQLMVHY